VRVKWFHRWNWRQPPHYNRRNHRKLLIADDQVAYVSGFNIHWQSSRRLYGDARWRDTHAGSRVRSCTTRCCSSMPSGAATGAGCRRSAALAAAPAGGHRLDAAALAVTAAIS